MRRLLFVADQIATSFAPGLKNRGLRKWRRHQNDDERRAIDDEHASSIAHRSENLSETSRIQQVFPRCRLSARASRLSYVARPPTFDAMRTRVRPK